MTGRLLALLPPEFGSEPEELQIALLTSTISRRRLGRAQLSVCLPLQLAPCRKNTPFARSARLVKNHLEALAAVNSAS